MGCDIHAFTEVKTPNGNWICAHREGFADGVDPDYPEDGVRVTLDEMPHINRHYALFGLLNSNVRCEFPFSFEERGFPDDASFEVRSLYEYEDSDAHSASHLTLQELKQKAAELLISDVQDARDGSSALAQLVISQMPPHEGDPSDQRLVFWFDN